MHQEQFVASILEINMITTLPATEATSDLIKPSHQCISTTPQTVYNRFILSVAPK